MYELHKLSLDESHKQRQKRALEIKLENVYDMKRLNDMNSINGNRSR